MLEDPKNPNHINPAYDCGDHLHPNDAGYQAMAKAVDLERADRGKQLGFVLGHQTEPVVRLVGGPREAG